jgi:hypothetical protein
VTHEIEIINQPIEVTVEGNAPNIEITQTPIEILIEQAPIEVLLNQQTIEVGIAQFISDGKIRISSADTTPSYLQSKLVAGNNIAFTKNNVGANETLTISSTAVSGTAWGEITGTLSNQTDLQNALNAKYNASNPSGFITSAALAGYVPTSRTLTINGTSYDLSANRSWTIDSGAVDSVNGQRGVVVLNAADVGAVTIEQFNSKPDTFIYSYAGGF